MHYLTSSSGQVRCWGNSDTACGSNCSTLENVDLGSNFDAVMVTVGADFTCVLSKAHVVKWYVKDTHFCVLMAADCTFLGSFGGSAYGRLGNGNGNQAVGDDPDEMGDNLVETVKWPSTYLLTY